MLNAKALSDLLTRNCDGLLCKRWFLMTTNGTLLAYSEPNEIRCLRRQAAMAAITWHEQQSTHDVGHSADAADGRRVQPAFDSSRRELRGLTIETGSANLLLCMVQPQLLLVLEGGVPPSRTGFEPRITPEMLHDEPNFANGSLRGDLTVQSPASSDTSDNQQNSRAPDVVRLQRTKLDAMASTIADVFERAGFRMPDENGMRLF